MNKKVSIKNKHIGYSSIIRMYPKEEGYLKKIQGIHTIKKLSSVSKIISNIKKGDKVLFAKNGGENILKVNLFNKNRLQLLADKRKLEKFIKIETTKKRTLL